LNLEYSVLTNVLTDIMLQQYAIVMG